MPGGPPVIATFLSRLSVGKPDPLSVGGDERISGRAETAEHVGLDLIEYPYEQLVGAAIDDAGAVRRDSDITLAARRYQCGRLRRCDRRTDDGRRRGPHAPPHRSADDGTADDQRARRWNHAAPTRHLPAYVGSDFSRTFDRPPETCRFVEHEERGRDVGNTRPPVLVQAAPEQRPNRRRYLRGQRLPVGIDLQHVGECVRDVLTLERTPAGEHFIEDAAERPDVTPFVHRLAPRLFRDSCTQPCP